MFEFTSQHALIGMGIGAVFGNCFPFPRQWWSRCQTPVGVLLVIGLAYFVYQGS